MPDPLLDIRLRWRKVQTQIMDAGASRARPTTACWRPNWPPASLAERAKSIGVRSLNRLSNVPDITTTTAARPLHHRHAPVCALRRSEAAARAI